MATDRFRKRRESLFHALSGVCDQIEVDLLEEQQAQTLESNATIQAQLDVIEKLRAENEKIREQLVNLQSSLKTSTSIDQPSTAGNATPSQPIVPSSLGTGSLATEKSLSVSCAGCKGDYSKVLRRYHAIAANFKTAKHALQRRKIERNQWARHAEYLTVKLREAEEKHGIQILDHRAPRIDVPLATAMDAEEGVSDPALSLIVDDSPPESEPELPVLFSKTVPDGETSVAPGASSQTTLGQASDTISQTVNAQPLHGDIALKQEPSSDAPEMIAERKIKKRKCTKEEVGAAVKTLVKSEVDGSSSPIMSIPTALPGTQESLDLGNIAQKVQTPRKRQMVDQKEPQTEIISRLKSGALTPASAQAPIYPHSAKLPRQNSVLMPLDGNIRRIRSTTEKRDTKGGRRDLAIAVAQLSEDCISDEVPESIKITDDCRNKPAKSRLDILLGGGSEEIDIITKATLTRNRPVTPDRGPALSVPRPRQLPFDKNEDRGGKHVHAPRVPATNSNTKPLSRASMPKFNQQQPAGILRHKPPSDLRLCDFKINPSANEGRDFAFSEVIRDKGDRACLPGCIDMHCCGKHFRALAISQRPDPPLTSAQRQEEQKLLEDYLGDSSYRLATMDKEERMELWIEAKTRELANKYGKHRHRFSRMRSPPGFWDADFPDTQQLEANRQEAVKRTEKAIAERYREALRPGGRWKFMDE